MKIDVLKFKLKYKINLLKYFKMKGFTIVLYIILYYTIHI